MGTIIRSLKQMLRYITITIGDLLDDSELLTQRIRMTLKDEN